MREFTSSGQIVLMVPMASLYAWLSLKRKISSEEFCNRDHIVNGEWESLIELFNIESYTLCVNLADANFSGSVLDDRNYDRVISSFNLCTGQLSIWRSKDSLIFHYHSLKLIWLYGSSDLRCFANGSISGNQEKGLLAKVVVLNLERSPKQKFKITTL